MPLYVISSIAFILSVLSPTAQTTHDRNLIPDSTCSALGYWEVMTSRLGGNGLPKHAYYVFLLQPTLDGYTTPRNDSPDGRFAHLESERKMMLASPYKNASMQLHKRLFDPDPLVRTGETTWSRIYWTYIDNSGELTANKSSRIRIASSDGVAIFPNDEYLTLRFSDHCDAMIGIKHEANVSHIVASAQRLKEDDSPPWKSRWSAALDARNKTMWVPNWHGLLSNAISY